MGGPDELRNDEASRYIANNFRPSDRLAIVLLNKRTGSVVQRLASADKIASPDFQAWLRHENAQRFEVYISMNALEPAARGRTKNEVAAIRHVYLDFDENGTRGVDELLKRLDVPKPNYLISSSPDKWQVVWKVEGFGKDQAEALQRNLARECGADPAATDCARVIRLPGFYNHKYARPYFIPSDHHAAEIYRPERFPEFPSNEWTTVGIAGSRQSRKKRIGTPTQITQSERDWAYAKRAIARGESPDLVIAAIASYRRYDKHNPKDYAARTVRKAAAAIEADRNSGTQPERR